MPQLKNLLLVFLAVAVAALAFLSWRQYRELTTLRGAALANSERADWQKRVWAAQKRTGSPGARTPASGPVPATTGKTPESTPAGGRPDISRMVTSISSMMDRPDAARLMALQQKAQIDARYAALFKKLGLPPDKLAQLKSLLADKLAAPMDVMAAGSQQGIDPVRSPQEFRQLVQDTQTQIDDRIKALLDPGSYAMYQNYLQTEPQRAVINQLRQSLSYTAAPLTDVQADQLVQILASTAPAGGAGPGAGATVTYVNRGPGTGAVFAVGSPGPDGPMPWGGGVSITDATMAQAQGVLSPAQLQALQEIQQQQQAAAQLRDQMFQRFSSGPAAGSAASGPNVLPPAPPPGG